MFLVSLDKELNTLQVTKNSKFSTG